jgi:hypothetical protein
VFAVQLSDFVYESFQDSAKGVGFARGVRSFGEFTVNVIVGRIYAYDVDFSPIRVFVDRMDA